MLHFFRRGKLKNASTQSVKKFQKKCKNALFRGLETAAAKLVIFFEKFSVCKAGRFCTYRQKSRCVSEKLKKFSKTVESCFWFLKSRRVSYKLGVQPSDSAGTFWKIRGRLKSRCVSYFFSKVAKNSEIDFSQKPGPAKKSMRLCQILKGALVGYVTSCQNRPKSRRVSAKCGTQNEGVAPNSQETHRLFKKSGELAPKIPHGISVRGAFSNHTTCAVGAREKWSLRGQSCSENFWGQKT